MLKVDIKNAAGGDDIHVMASGDILSIVAEVAIVINGVYTQLSQASPVLGRVFRQNLISLAFDPESPLWEARNADMGICITVPKNSKEES